MCLESDFPASSSLLTETVLSLHSMLVTERPRARPGKYESEGSRPGSYAAVSCLALAGPTGSFIQPMRRAGCPCLPSDYYSLNISCGLTDTLNFSEDVRVFQAPPLTHHDPRPRCHFNQPPSCMPARVAAVLDHSCPCPHS